MCHRFESCPGHYLKLRVVTAILNTGICKITTLGLINNPKEIKNMNFKNAMENTLNDRKQLTENGAIGYATTGKKLLDLNFAVSSMRNWSEEKICNAFMDAYYEDKLIAVKWLFYLGDIRGGLGERKTFKTCMKWLAKNQPKIASAVLVMIPEYSRWDYMFDLIDTELSKEVFALVKKQLENDVVNMKVGKPVSLLAKWMPSETASKASSHKLAVQFADYLMPGDQVATRRRRYRKTISELRKYLNVIETKMCAGQWNEINYEAVPSKANLIYNAAFLRHDEERRRAYLGALEKGEAKINSSVCFPHDIVHNYAQGDIYYYGNRTLKNTDPALEAMWKALPDYVKEDGNTIVIADGSGSMTCRAGQNSTVTCLEVANALAIYFAERCSGPFKDSYITFSNRPQLVDMSKATTLREKIMIALKHNEVASTNVEAVFQLILKTAVSNNMKQEEIPKNILILSDMEFNSATCGVRPDATLFHNIAAQYAQYGYKLPRLVFWNINSRTGAIPVKQNEAGVALVSGFSPAIVKMVLSAELDPYKCLLEQLNTERYQPIEDAVLAAGLTKAA